MDFVRRNRVKLKPGDDCLLYGAGNTGVELSAILLRNGIRPLAFLDTKKTGCLEGLPILSPDRVPPEWRRKPIVISVFNTNSGSGTHVIESRLRQLEFSGSVDFETFYQDHPSWFEKPHFWLAGHEYFAGKSNELRRAESIFSDSRSQELFHLQSLHRQGESYRILPEPSPVEHQYFDPEIFSHRQFSTFVDIGAYIGDSLESAVNGGFRLDRVIAYEPDPINFKKLREYLSLNVNSFDECIAIPVGVSDHCGVFQFAADGTSGAKFEQSPGTISVPVVDLDSTLRLNSIAYIKMDIEGGENAALLGMKKLLKKHRPALAVCIYHRPQDFFEIPLLLQSMLEHYHFHLRCYGAHCFDTVLYAIPGN